jgi:protein-disulfide isomerase
MIYRAFLLRMVVPVVGLALAVSASWAQAPAAPPTNGLSPLDKPQEQLPPPPSNALDKKDLEFYVRHLYLWGPHIQVEIGDFTPGPLEGLRQTTVKASYGQASQQTTLYVSKDGKQIFEGRTFEISKNPFQANLEKITTASQPSFGTPGAPVVIVAYSDFQCPYCAQEAKVLREQLLQAFPDKVRVYFHDYPLANHNWAMDAAITGQCIYRYDPVAFWDYHDWIFENQSSITPENLKDKAVAFATGKGIDGLKLSSCIEKRETESNVKLSIEEGRSVGVTSTPTVFLNGRQLAGSAKWEELKQIIEYELEYQKIAKNAGDDCGCEMSLPFPAEK